MSDQLELEDGRQNLLEDRLEGRLYRLDVKIEGAVDRPTAVALGPALNALYARALTAIQADSTLGGLACDISEDNPDGPSLEIAINHRAFQAPSAAFALTIAVSYWQPEGVAARREPILEALTAALVANAPGPDPCVREAVLTAIVGELEAGLGIPILRNVDRPVDCASGAPVAVFHDGDQSANAENLGTVLYTCRPALELFVPGGDEALLDSHIQLALAAIRGSDHPGGVAVELLEGDTDPEVLRQEYSGPLVAARIDLECTYATIPGEPYTAML